LRQENRSVWTKKAIQKHAAITAVIMNLRGETSNDVSEIVLPNAKPLIIIASCNEKFIAFHTIRTSAEKVTGTSKPGFHVSWR